jgi:hypothetical protein
MIALEILNPPEDAVVDPEAPPATGTSRSSVGTVSAGVYRMSSASASAGGGRQGVGAVAGGPRRGSTVAPTPSSLLYPSLTLYPDDTLFTVDE